MSVDIDITQFYQTFFEEAEELLVQMEQLLLEVDIESPDAEALNAIFRAAHSIKGGAATFGFTALTETTHIFENLLDHLVILGKGEILLNRSLDEISNRLLFARTSILPEESIYSEENLSGYFSIIPNEDGEENTPDIELLYKAVLQQPEKIKSMFQ